MSTKNSLAELLRESRSQRGESLRAAAKNLGVDASYLSRVESGARRPSDELRRRFSDYYGIHDDALTMAVGDIPSDVVEILRSRPELIEQIRAQYGKSH